MTLRAPPRTCGPRPVGLRPGALRARSSLSSEAGPSLGVASCPLAPIFLLRPRPGRQASSSPQVGPYETPESSEGRSLRREAAGPGRAEPGFRGMRRRPRPCARPLPGNERRRSGWGPAGPMGWHAAAQPCVAGRLREVRGVRAACGAGRGAAGAPEERWRPPELT